MPITPTPSIIPIVAGTTPRFEISFSTFKAVSTFLGYGIPWEIIVDSNATTGFLFFNASSTFFEILIFI